MFDPSMTKTDDQCRAYLTEVDRLAANDPEPETPDGDRLQVPAKRVAGDDKERLQFRRPDPIEPYPFQPR